MCYDKVQYGYYYIKKYFVVNVTELKTVWKNTVIMT